MYHHKYFYCNSLFLHTDLHNSNINPQLILNLMIIDTREHELIRLLAGSVPPPTIKQLPIGDIWIGAGLKEDGSIVPVSGGILAERKTIQDFEASVLDGRYREQKTRLLAYCKETNTRPLYILEGPYSFTTGRLQIPALMKLVLRLQYKYGIPIIHTISTKETATLVKTMDEMFQEDATIFADPNLSLSITEQNAAFTSLPPAPITSLIHVSKKANANDPVQFAMSCVAGCTGISPAMAGRIVSHFGSMEELMAASAETLAAIDGDTKKIGPVVGKRLHGLLHSTFKKTTENPPPQCS